MVRASSVSSGPELDYQASVIRVVGNGNLLVVFERIDPVSFSGDLYVTTSSDEGLTWSTPQAVFSTARNERHPSLVQLGDASFALFYLVDETGAGSFE